MVNKRPWWETNPYGDSYWEYDNRFSQLLEDASKMFDAIAYLRAETVRNQGLDMTRLKTDAEVIADMLLDKVVNWRE